MRRRENDLGKDPVGVLLFRMALPTVAAQVVNALYNIVDRMYIGHIETVGDLALTGVGVCFPATMLIGAVAGLIGGGGGPRAVVRMGEGKEDQANQILGNCAVLMFVLSVAMTTVFQIFREPMLLLFGATENTLPYASGYLSVYLWGNLFAQMTLALNPFITAQGFTAVSMGTVMIGAVVNILLDPIFIFALDMGVEGAAIATVIGQVASAAWVIGFLRGKRTRLRLQRVYLRLNPKVLAPVLALGISPSIMQVTESLVSISFNSSLRTYGGDPAVGAMTICSSVLHVFTLIILGVAQGAQPIIGFNYGSGDFGRVKKTVGLLTVCLLSLSAFFLLTVEIFPGGYVAMFNDKPELVEIAVWALRVYNAGLVFFGIQCTCQQTFLALGQAKVSLFLVVFRKIVLVIPLVFTLPLFLENQVFAVFLAQPIADVLAGTTTGCVFLHSLPRILERRQEYLKGQTG